VRNRYVPGFIKAVWRHVRGKAISGLLLVSPFALLSYLLDWGPLPTFIFNFIVLVPLAALLGDLTEVGAYRGGGFWPLGYGG
jgi:Ca2+/H+ antiporter